jgi:hypothetical protein
MRTGLGLLAAAAVLLGCGFSVDPDEGRFRCAEDADCGDGYVCVAQPGGEGGLCCQDPPADGASCP